MKQLHEQVQDVLLKHTKLHDQELLHKLTYKIHQVIQHAAEEQEMAEAGMVMLTDRHMFTLAGTINGIICTLFALELITSDEFTKVGQSIQELLNSFMKPAN